MAVRIVSTQVVGDGREIEILFEADSREELVDPSIYRMAQSAAAQAGFGLDCAIANAPGMYPVTEDGSPINYPEPGRTPLRFRRAITLSPGL